jgi:hypothetical protein
MAVDAGRHHLRPLAAHVHRGKGAVNLDAGVAGMPAAATLTTGTLLAAAVPAYADPGPTGPAGPPVPLAMAPYLAYKECVPGGATAGDAILASQLSPQLNGHLAHALNGYEVSCARAIFRVSRSRGLNDRRPSSP